MNLLRLDKGRSAFISDLEEFPILNMMKNIMTVDLKHYFCDSILRLA